MRNIIFYTDCGEIHISDDDNKKKSDVSDIIPLLEGNSMFKIETKTETLILRPSRIIGIKVVEVNE
jgi:hypothetical protein